MKTVLSAALGLMVLAVSGSWASASIIHIPVGGTNQNGEWVDVSADFQFSDNQVAITISNHVSDMHSVGQAIRSLSFGLTTGQTEGWLAGSTATQRTIDKDGTFTDRLAQITDWNLNLTGGFFNLTYSAPNQTIIGEAGDDDLYNYANSSLTGNKPHNPFLLSGATFYLALPGVSGDTQVRNVVFGLGTGTDKISELQPVPEPATAGSLGLLALGGLLLRRRSRAA